MVGFHNYFVFFLFRATYIQKRRINKLFYNFTYNN